jgi:spore germination cell wall hydrolase CwlJ-like protein
MVLILALALMTTPALSQAPAHRTPEICPGATYFYERHHPKPYWAKRMVVVCTVGDHIFLKERKQ